MKMFCIHDSKAEAYMSPFYFKTKAEAIRAFSASCQEPDSNLSKFASDYTLVEIGEFNETTAEINTHLSPIILANASEFQTRLSLKQPVDELALQN
jgi:hypothetical protein